MATHYKLVACYKNKYNFINEQELNEFFNHPITSLEEIDRITCRYPDADYLINLLDNDGIISGKNHLSIRYKSKDKNNYLHPIFNIPDLVDAIDDLQVIQTIRDGRPITYKIVSHKNPFYQEKLKEFYSYIDTNPDYFFSEVYGNNIPKRLFHLVKLYTDSKMQVFDTLDDEYEYKDKMKEMELEFSRYKTFRGYLVYTNRLIQNNELLNNHILDTSITTNYTQNNISEPEIDFDDKEEEFLSQEEIDSAVNDGDDWYHGPRCR